ncbi:hypothetical protein Pelo_14061 [Pelomyxa schiedti]|nr:hypothetical protein Pelo_14061 [Pelomyxa schiedti]
MSGQGARKSTPLVGGTKSTTSNKVQAVDKEVHAVAEQMTENVAVMLNNQQKLNELEVAASNLESNAAVFIKEAHGIKTHMRCKNWKLCCIIILIVVAILLVIAIVVIIPLVLKFI